MEHLHVKQPEAVSTTTVALLPSQQAEQLKQ
jgi:hypothetical protein